MNIINVLIFTKNINLKNLKMSNAAQKETKCFENNTIYYM